MNAVVENPFKRGAAVKATADLMRVAALPRRVWSPEQGKEFAAKVTSLLKTPQGQMSLRPIQAISLFELAEVGGLFGPQRVGAGKTLLSLLAPTVLQRVKNRGFRPLLLVPASLLEKTERDRRLLADHWIISPFFNVRTYEWLGRVQAAGALAELRPDLIILDECHKVKNTKASVTRRIRRYVHECSDINKPGFLPIFAAFSGTITKRSLMDFAHILRWCLAPDKQPIPLHFQDLMDWSDALEEKKEGQTRMAPGELKIFCNDEENKIWKSEPLRAARLGFRRRLIETQGIVATEESPIDASLTIRSVVQRRMSEATEQAFKHLRQAWETPDGWPIADGLAMFRHARELSMGFYYKWDPRPPQAWLEARRVWAKFVRDTIKHSRKLDSELQVRMWVQQHNPQQKELAAWLAIKDTFEPNTVPVWIDDTILNTVDRWARAHEGIIWVEHRTVGERIEAELGVPYYANMGRDGKNRFIDDHPSGSLAASIASNKEGRNLQRWAENFILSMPTTGTVVEQLLGRTHRDHQQADEVVAEILLSCIEHREAFEQARRDAEYIESSTGTPQKLKLAGIYMEELWGLPGPRWNK